MKFIIKIVLNKKLIALILKVFFKVKVNGLENIKDLQGNFIFITNHNSFIDAMLLWAFIPEDLCFTINPIIAKKWYIKPLLNVTKFFQIDPSNPMAVKSIIEEVKKGINDEFLKLYFDYQEHFKVVTSFGQGHLNAINPKTNRIHTVYKQLGAASGRMSCGSQQSNTDLAKVNKVPAKDCTYPNMQQLPADEQTRSSFTAPEGYEWCSCDYSA